MNFPGGQGLVNLTPPAGYMTGGLSVLTGLILAVIQLLLVGAVILAFIFLVIGGIRWITSAGDKQGVAGARGTITYAMVGLVLALLSFLILKTVSSFLGVDLGVGY